LMELFGTPARTKIINVFVSERNKELSASEISRLADISRSAVYDHIDHLENLGVIDHTRDAQDGYSPVYKFNEGDEIAEFCYKLEGTVLKRILELDGNLPDQD